MMDASNLNHVLSAIAAAFTVMGVIGGVIVWALATKFATKHLVYEVRNKVVEQRDASRKEAWLKDEAWRGKIEAELRQTLELAHECNRRHDLAREPFSNVVAVLKELKDDLKNMVTRAETRDAKLIEAIQSLDKRLVVVEHRPASRRRSGGSSGTTTTTIPRFSL